MTRKQLIWTVTALWLLAFVIACVSPFLTEPTGDGFTRGLNRIGVFLGWQVAACVLAFTGFQLGYRKPELERRERWMSRVPAIIQLALVLLIIVLILIGRYAARPALENPIEPRPVTAPAAVSLTTVQPVAVPAPALETYNGIYRSGFEASHFYTMEGQGPWWLETDNENWEQIQQHYIDGPGRAGGAYVALTVSGWLEDVGDDLNAVGAFEYRIRVESIEAIRGLSAEEFDLVLESISN